MSISLFPQNLEKRINIPYGYFQVNKALLELIKASEMKKKPTDWTNLTMENPGIEIHNHCFRPFFFFEGCSETNINIPLYALSDSFLRLLQEETNID